MGTPQKDLTMEEKEDNKFLYCFGEPTEQETNYLIKTGQLVQQEDGNYANVSTLSESGFTKDLDQSILSEPVTPTQSSPATPAHEMTENAGDTTFIIGLEDVNLFQTPVGTTTTRNSRVLQSTTPIPIQSITATPACEEVTENDGEKEITFIGLDGMDLFQTPAGAAQTMRNTRNSRVFQSTTPIPIQSITATPAGEEVTDNDGEKENTFIGLEGVDLFQTPAGAGQTMRNTRNSKVLQSTTPIPIQSIPTTPACEEVTENDGEKENTFIGLEGVDLFQTPAGAGQTMRNTRNSRVLQSTTPIPIQNISTTRACEEVTDNDGEKENTFIGLEGVDLFQTPAGAGQTMRNTRNSRARQCMTPLPVQSIPVTPAGVEMAENVGEKTFIGLEDANLFLTPVGTASPMRTTRNSLFFRPVTPLLLQGTPATPRGKRAGLVRENTFIGLEDMFQSPNPLPQIVRNTPVTPAGEECTENVGEKTFIGLDDVNLFHTPAPLGPASAMRKTRNSKTVERVTPLLKGTPATPRGKLVRENTFLGLEDVNMFQSPLGTVKSSPTAISRNSTSSHPLIEFCTPITNSENPSRRSKTFSGPKNNLSALQIKKQSMSFDLLKFEDSNASLLSQEQPLCEDSVNLMILDSSKDGSKNSTEDLDDTFEAVTKLLAMADAQDAEEAIQNAQEIPVMCSPRLGSAVLGTPSQSASPLKSKRVLQLCGKNTLFSPSPPRPLPNSASTPIFKTPTSRPKTPKVSSSPSRKLYADIPAKVDSGLRKSSGFSLGLDSPVADYIHSKAAPSPFQRVIGIPNRVMSTGKPANSKPVGATMIPRPSLPFLAGSSKFNAKPASASGQTESKFKQLQYTGSKATLMNNASFVGKHQKENYVAERHTGVRAENVDVSLVQGGVVEKKFLGQKLPKFPSQLRQPHNFHV